MQTGLLHGFDKPNRQCECHGDVATWKIHDIVAKL